MLLTALIIWSAAVVLGMGLSLFHLGVFTSRSAIVAAVHGVAALAGLGLLVLALRGPPHGFANGVQSFGVFAAAFAGAALLFGAAFLFFPNRVRHGWPIGAHATLGITAYVFLSGYLLLG